MAGQRPNSIMVLSGMFCSSLFEDILIVAWGGPLLYTEEIFWDSRPLCDDLCSVRLRVAQYAIHQSCQAIKYT